LAANPGSLFEFFKPKGWILLTGAMPSIGPVFPDLADRLLGRVDLSRPLLGITAGDAGSDELQVFIKELEDLIGEEGIILPLRDATGHQIEEAGIMILSGGNPLEWLQYLKHDDLERRLLDFLRADGFVIAAGAPAGALGSWILEEDAISLHEGAGWLPDAVVLPGIHDPIELPGVRELLGAGGCSFALGVPPDAALAVGPGGVAEVWSLTAPKLVLGKGWQE
jgi:hypothetical protein